jgi:hypothetical protein
VIKSKPVATMIEKQISIALRVSNRMLNLTAGRVMERVILGS